MNDLFSKLLKQIEQFGSGDWGLSWDSLLDPGLSSDGFSCDADGEAKGEEASEKRSTLKRILIETFDWQINR